MSQRKEQKEETKRRILEAASQSFKEGGYGGIGIDGLAKKAGVTSGAFYVHFKSKAEAFKASVVAGLIEVQEAVNHLQKAHGKAWWSEFAKVYMGHKRTCDLHESCALQSITPEVARFDEATKKAYEEELKKIIELASTNVPKENQDKVWANFAMLVGGVTLARAVNDQSIAEEIAVSIENSIYEIEG